MVEVYSLTHPGRALWVGTDGGEITVGFGAYGWHDHHGDWTGADEASSFTEALADIAAILLPPTQAAAMAKRRNLSGLVRCRRLNALAIGLQTVLAIACAPRRVPVLPPELTFAQRDSVEQAYRAGIRDAWRLEHPNRSPGDIAMLAALPGGLVAMRVTRSPWALPGIWVGVGLTSSLLAHRTDRQPLPLPPDSMRQHYAFRSEVMWRRYQFGYQTVVDQSRRGKVDRSTRFLAVGVTSLLVTAILAHR